MNDMWLFILFATVAAVVTFRIAWWYENLCKPKAFDHDEVQREADEDV